MIFGNFVLHNPIDLVKNLERHSNFLLLDTLTTTQVSGVATTEDLRKKLTGIASRLSGEQ